MTVLLLGSLSKHTPAERKYNKVKCALAIKSSRLPMSPFKQLQGEQNKNKHININGFTWKDAGSFFTQQEQGKMEFITLISYAPPVAEGRLFIALCQDPSSCHLDGSNMGGRVNMREQKKQFKIIDIISYVLEMGINGCRTVFVVYFRS